MATVIPVKVAVRVRPFVSRETDEGSQPCLTSYVSENQIGLNERMFAFDYVFDSDASQYAVYESCAAPLINTLFTGYNCTVFAYGQTGSGKTFTMGTEETTSSMLSDSRGIIPRLATDIFDYIAALSGSTFKICCSMLEIYEERVLDLLAESKDELQLREAGAGVFVQGLSEHIVASIGDTIGLLERGCGVRSQGQTAMNSKSSRSHAIFTIHIHKTDTTGKGTSCKAKLNLVDLAGSERLSKTQASGLRMKEGIKINEGLLALGSVISALTESDKSRHVPYRNSKLTRLLQDSLGGNSHTIMIACVSPADSNCDETLSTLRYAERAKKIKNKPIVNQDPAAAEVIALRQKVHQLTRELIEYRDSGLGVGSIAAMDTLKLTIVDLEKQARTNQSKLLNLMGSRTVLMDKLATAEEKMENLREKLTEAKEAIHSELGKLSETNDDDRKTKGALAVVQQAIEQCHDTSVEEEDMQSEAKTYSSDTDSDEVVEAGDMEKALDRHDALSAEVQEIFDRIKLTEKLMAQAEGNHQSLAGMHKPTEKDISDLEDKIKVLESERNKLSSELKRTTNLTKISEERRRKLLELEKELDAQKKKLREMQKLEKLKAQSDANVKRLHDEVQALKQMRVKLMKQLREESDKYRQWQVSCKRTITQMKAKDRKREVEAIKTKRNFEQQLTVYRRKYDEAVRHSKRLQQQLSLQQVHRGVRLNEIHDDEKISIEIRKFLEEEFELSVSMEQAQLICKGLLDQRKELNKQLTRVNRQLSRAKQAAENEPPKKKRIVGESSSESFVVEEENDEIARLEFEKDDLQKEIDLRSLQMQELNSKLASFDADAKCKQRWNSVHTVLHAKIALKQLFDMAVCESMDKLNSIQNAEELKGELGEAVKCMQVEHAETKETIHQLQGHVKANEKIRAKAQRDHENTVHSLLRHIATIMGGKELSEEAMSELRAVHNRLDNAEQLRERNDMLSQELNRERVRKGTRTKFFKDLPSTIETKPTRMSRTRSSREVRAPTKFGNIVDSSEMKLGDDSFVVEPVEEEGDEYLPQVSKSKQTTSGCKCPNNCRTKLCRCRKGGSGCSDTCLCPSPCCNKVDVMEQTPHTTTKTTLGGGEKPNVNNETFNITPDSFMDENGPFNRKFEAKEAAEAESSSPEEFRLSSKGLCGIKKTKKKYFH